MSGPDDLGSFPNEVQPLDQPDPADRIGHTDKGVKVGAGYGLLAAVVVIGSFTSGYGRFLMPVIGVAALVGLLAGIVKASSPPTRRTGTIILTALGVTLLVTACAVGLWMLALSIAI